MRAEAVRRALVRAAIVACIMLAAQPILDRVACWIAPLFPDSHTMYYWFAYPWHACVAAVSVLVASLLERRVALAIPAVLLAAFVTEVQCDYLCLVVQSGSTIKGLKEFAGQASDGGRWWVIRGVAAALPCVPVCFVLLLRARVPARIVVGVLGAVLSAVAAPVLQWQDGPSMEHAIFWATTDVVIAVTLAAAWRPSEPSAPASEPTSSSA